MSGGWSLARRRRYHAAPTAAVARAAATATTVPRMNDQPERARRGGGAKTDGAGTVDVSFDELCGFGIAHIVYEGDKHSVPERLVHELSGAVRSTA